MTRDDAMFKPFFFEYFLYHGYLTEGEEQTIRGAVFSFFEKYKTDFHSLLSYELQKKVNEFWQESSYSREVYKALSAFVVHWKRRLNELQMIDYKAVNFPHGVISTATPYYGDICAITCQPYGVTDSDISDKKKAILEKLTMLRHRGLYTNELLGIMDEVMKEIKAF